MPPQPHPLPPLIRLSRGEEEQVRNNDNSPLPRNTLMHKNNGVDNRDIQRSDSNKETHGNRPEQERVAPETQGPLARALSDAVEEGAARVDELPGEEEEDPHHGRVAGGAGAEDVLAGVAVLEVAVVAEVAVVEAKEDDDEGAEEAGGHDEAVADEVGDEFGGEDAVFELGKRKRVSIYCFDTIGEGKRSNWGEKPTL